MGCWNHSQSSCFLLSSLFVTMRKISRKRVIRGKELDQLGGIHVETRLVDRYGRVHDYLRISVTDRCNLRCLYCMPAEGMEFMSQNKLLTDDEIEEVVRAAAKLGVRKIRLTGGEPTVRPGLPQLIKRIASIPGIIDVALTTNGLLLGNMAAHLHAAGLQRVNISIDSLQPERFKQMTRGGDLSKVLTAIEKCVRIGFSPIKLNVVLVRGYNEDEFDDFLRLTVDQPLTVRFIEYMPIGGRQADWKQNYLSLEERLYASELGRSAVPIAKPEHGGPAEYYRLPNALGSFGLIHPVSEHFCDTCNRLRLTADGFLKPCLYWSDEFQIRRYIGDEHALMDALIRSLDAKPLNHEMARELSGQQLSHEPTTRTMSQIGG